VRTRFVVLVLAFLAVSAGLGAADDPLVGTWKLNLAKSKFSPPPPPQDTTIKYEPYGANGIKVNAEITDEKGKTTVTVYSGSFDGKDFTVSGSVDADTGSMRRIDAYTTEVANKKAGKATTTLRRAVSKDGKTLTIRAKGTDGKGRPVNSVEVFDKQ
jgi:hypothetical protein